MRLANAFATGAGWATGISLVSLLRGRRAARRRKAEQEAADLAAQVRARQLRKAG